MLKWEHAKINNDILHTLEILGETSLAQYIREQSQNKSVQYQRLTTANGDDWSVLQLACYYSGIRWQLESNIQQEPRVFKLRLL